MKKLVGIIMIMVLTISLAACGSNSSGNNPGSTSSTASSSQKSDSEYVAIAYNNPPQWANWEAVQSAFKEKTGIKVPADNKNSGQTLTALIAEKNNPIADVAYYGIVFGPKAVENDVVQPYKSKYFDEIPEKLKDPDGKWMTIHYGAIAFIVNTQALGDVPVPKSWADLLRPEYKGKVGFLDPTSAAVGYSVATAVNLAMGGSMDDWEPGFEYLRKLEQNQVIHPKTTATAKVIKGEIPILIDADFNGYKAKYNDNAPVEVVIPQEGTIKVPYIVSLVKNAPHEQEGKEYIDFILSDEGQVLFANGFVRPIRDIDIPKETEEKFLPAEDYERAKDVDISKMNEVEADFINRWKAEVISQ